MVSTATFARMAARPIDRLHIASSVVPSRDELGVIEGFDVPLVDAAFVVSFLARDGMTWQQVQVPLRYAPQTRVRARLQACVQSGVVTFDDDFLAYTPAGVVAARAVLEARFVALDEMWANTAQSVSVLRSLAEPVATAATSAGKPSSDIIDATISVASESEASALWGLLAKIRRHRADCHAQAWAEAGHTIESIIALAGDAPRRESIEARTDDLNADIWSYLPEDAQLRFMAHLASLDGAGTPT